MKLRSCFIYLLATGISAAALGCGEEPTTPSGMAPAAVPELAVASNTWTTRHDMPSTERYALAAATVTDPAGQSVLYAIGGRTAGGASLGKVLAYHVATNSWTYPASLPSALYEMNGAGVVNGKIYVSGGLVGNNGWVPFVYMYDPAANTWTRKGDMPHPTSGGVTAVFNNQLYVLTNCGGDACSFSNDVPLFYRYDPATDTWTSLPAPGSSHTRGMGGFIGGKFYVTGGLTGVGDPKHLDVYDPATNHWTTAAPIARMRWAAAGVTVASKLYLVGGFQMNADGTAAPAIRATSVYDPATNTWSTKAQLPTARADIAGSRVVVNGKPQIEVVGGARPGNNLAYTP
jgi:N-acetylneuraminic acid mutarotase